MQSMPSHNDAQTSADALRPLDIERGERLLHRLTEFGHLLWQGGIPVGPPQVLDLVESLRSIDITNRDDFYQTLKCSLLTHHEQETLFDQVFAYFWFASDSQDNQTRKQTSHNTRRPQHLRLPPSERKRLAEHLNSPDPRKELRGRILPDQLPPMLYEEDERERADGDPQGTAYSAIERLLKKDFEHFSWDEVQEAKKLMAAMRWNLGMRSTRRKTPARHGGYLDMRRMLRRNLKYGAEMIELTRREIKRKPRPLVIICDISGSMSLYSRLLLHFIHTITHGLMHVEAFVFGTRLTRITRQLQQRDVDEAVRDVSKSVQDWSGGTRIGDALHTFHSTWARRVLHRSAVVLLISDGWDRGEPGVLKAEMDRLQHRCHRLIWLNPLLGSSDYRPLTTGMKTALHFIDDFLPAHNLNSLIKLGNLLSTIDDTRPPRTRVSRKS